MLGWKLLAAVLPLALGASLSPEASTWHCVDAINQAIAPGATWQQMNCSTILPLPWGKFGPIRVNMVTADLSTGSLRLVPGVSPPEGTNNAGLAKLDDMAATSPYKVLAGTNGGYFWETNKDSFTDLVCRGKTRADATSPVSDTEPNFGVGDGTVIIDGQLKSSNCDCWGYSRPALLSVSDTGVANITVQTRGERAPPGTNNAISGGPNLVSWNATSGTGYIDIPEDDDNINLLEHSANTAIALSKGGTLVNMVTFDGKDGCKYGDTTCGINSYQMAYFMRDYLRAERATGFDQGGSTTMFVTGQGTNGIVTNPGEGVRPVFSGVFLVSR